MKLTQLLFRYWLVVVIYEIASGAVCAFIAQNKRRDQGIWFIIGLLLGIAGIVVALIMGRLPDEKAAKNNLLLDSTRRLRSGWRILLFLIAIFVLYYLLAVLAELTRVVPPQSLFFLFYIVILLVTFMMLRFVDKRRFASVGFPYHGKIFKEILLGFVIGTVMIGLVGWAELVVGAIKLNPRPDVSPLMLIRNFGLSLIFFAYFAMGEELLFRGYPYQALIEGTGVTGATILMSVVFGAMHLMNPQANLFSTVNTMLAGVWLSIAYLKTRSLYFPFGMHFSWNIVQSFFLSLPVSGLLTNRTLFIPTDYGPEWLTGGRYGPEAGAGTTAIMVIVIVYFILEKRIRPSYDFARLNERLQNSESDPSKGELQKGN